MEIRREVLSSIRKRIEDCNQLNAHYTNVSHNLDSIHSDPANLEQLTPTELSDVVSTFPHSSQLESECAQLQSQVLEQKEQLATQEQKLEELTLKIEDVETLLEDVSGAAYDKAVEVVTDKVREQTQLEDMEVIEKYRKSVVSPNAKNSPEVVKIANTLLSRVREKLQQSAEKVLKKVQAVLLKPEVKQAGKEQIKNKARKSIKEKLAQGKLDADRENRERWEREGRIAPTRKQDMEL